jgi:hypothetical protein
MVEINSAKAEADFALNEGVTMTFDNQGKVVRFSESVPDLDRYNREMAKGIFDKLFFVDHIEADVIVDYGCANGAMLGILARLFPEKTYVGYEISEAEVTAARVTHEGMTFTSDWNEVVETLRPFVRRGQKTAVTCSSIVHEVLSYGNPEEIETFWTRIFDQHSFHWVVIRDMCASRSLSRPSDPISVAKVRQIYDPAAIVEFEQQWGTLESNWSLVHFLLKYRYKANWSRELTENYFPINLEALMSRIPRVWTPVMVEHFTLPFIRRQVMADFGIDLQDRTHLKLILHNSAVRS